MRALLPVIAIADAYLATPAAYADVDETLLQPLSLAGQMKSGVMQEMLGMKLPPEKQKLLSEFQDRISRVVLDALAWEKLKAPYVKLFAEAYSEEEIDDLVAFYKSPTGQAMVAKTPALMVKSSQIVEQRITGIQPELQRLLREFTSQTTQPAIERK